MKKKDNINPNYYKEGIQVTDFILSYNMEWCEGNIIKYVTRYKAKNGLEDLKKAKWYLEKLIEKTKGEK
jgi:hypothetical protein|tara:strand:+ start:414 stop:620 length:207 start_codon:yes stop_codon:yes gene_type:complete